MAQRFERCPHCNHIGADLLRSERRSGLNIEYFVCRSCDGEWLDAHDSNESVFDLDSVQRTIEGTYTIH
jgi:Zn-finger nucleic acid-binding protein